MKAKSLIAALAGAGLLMAAAVASAGNPCIKSAKGEAKDCKAGCTEDFQSAKDACLNRDHVCVEACRDGRQQCVDSTGIKAAFAQCQSDLEAAKATCRANNPKGSQGRDDCIDQAQVVAFECRVHVRKTYGPLVKACKKGFRSCASACPPGSGPSDDPAACRHAAKDTYNTCRAACTEDFQVAKDACLNRDHACVEDCRDVRHDCQQQVQDQLDPAIAACNATRDTALDNCHSLYGGAGQEQQLADCVMNARVDAFECRDQAHENARPGFETCRTNFRDCAQACPPPAP
jgi:hypothetical protein